MGSFGGIIESLDYIRQQRDPILHYSIGGSISGLLGGCFSNLLTTTTVPRRFRIFIAIKSALVFGLFGGISGGVQEFLWSVELKLKQQQQQQQLLIQNKMKSNHNKE